MRVAPLAAVSTGLAALSLLLTGCSGDDGDKGPRFTAVDPPRVALAAKDVPAGTKVGVLVSATSPLGEGADFLGPAAGARVATYRLAQGGATVELDVVDDHGDAAAATKAVDDLAADGVVGIVAATRGAHLDAALKHAADKGLAVLLPYETRTVDGATTSWLTGPTGPQVRTSVEALLRAQKLSAPWVLHGEGYDSAVSGLAPTTADTAVTAGQSPRDAVAAAVAALRTRRADSVVLAAGADTSAALVAELQGAAGDVPVVLGPAATSPRFAAQLAQGQTADGTATTSGALYSVGTTGPGREAFLAAVQVAAGDEALRSLLGRTSFGEAGAATADEASHDAVLALVRAAAKARSTDAGAVLQALRGLALGTGDGLAGPALDLTDTAAVPADGVVALASTTQDTGDRIGVAEARPALTWFALPGAKG